MEGQVPTTRKPRICFVALNAYNVLSGREDIQHTGGAEVQQLQIASWLVRQGYGVSFVTLDHDQADGIEKRGIRVHKAYAKEDGIPGLRFLYPRWSGLWKAMARADADVYYQRGPECETGQVALWCYLHRRKFIFAAANALSCDPQLMQQEPWRERAFYRLGVRLADAVTAQTKTQQEQFRRNMGLETELIRNCGQPSSTSALRERSLGNHTESMRVLWVGRINQVKRFEWLLDVAERCPNTIFEVVGAPGSSSSYASSLIARANGTPNVSMHGYVPHGGMDKYYRRCHVLCCTSPYEGFPNTFLEAWVLGMPVVSTFDPDGVVAGNGLGWVAQDVDEIVTCLGRVAKSPELWFRASNAAREYYLRNHTPEVSLPLFERLLLRVTECEKNSTS